MDLAPAEPARDPRNMQFSTSADVDLRTKKSLSLQLMMQHVPSPDQFAASTPRVALQLRIAVSYNTFMDTCAMRGRHIRRLVSPLGHTTEDYARIARDFAPSTS